MHFSFKPLLYSFAIPFLSLMIICLSSQAQRRSPGMNADGNLLGGSKASSGGGGYLPTEGWGVAQNVGYETPMGDLKDIYKGGPTIGISVIKRWNHFILGATLDYRSFTPKVSSFSYPFDETDPSITAEASYSKFTGIGFYAGAAYEVLITPGASFYLGANIGSLISKYDYQITVGEFYSESGGGSSQMPYIAPKIGLNIAVTGAVSVGLEARYSLKYGGGTYNSREGGSVTQGYNSAAGNLIVAYSF